ncbi:MAG: DNA gyrase/topoisomerase IV subunit A, partial [Bacteroidales bacterium]|nr:DNA gyrase/topoisomerase IV subunit A [Bacteroidales bacterium]
VYYAKRVPVTSITRDKEYDITMGTPGSRIEYFSANHNGEAETVRVQLRAKPKLKKTVFEYDFSTLAIKSKTARGNLVSKNVIQRISLRSKGVSTISGKEIWYDTDIQKLNDEGHGLYLGEFAEGDKVLAVFKGGTFYTTSFDLVNRYPGDVLLIEKFDPDKTFTALYWDAAVKSFYVKRFSFVISDNTPMSFIAEGSKSYLVELSSDRHPQYEVFWKQEDKPSELVDAEEWIAKKGVGAKGKKVVDRGEVKSVRFAEPLEKPEDEEPEVEETVEEQESEAIQDAPVAADEAPAAIEKAPAAGKPVVTGKEIRIPETADEEPIELIFEEPTLF